MAAEIKGLQMFSTPVLLAALGFAAALLTALYHTFDGDENTVASWAAVETALFTLLATWKLRPNNVSDEEAGIPPARTSAAHYYALHQPNQENIV